MNKFKLPISGHLLSLFLMTIFFIGSCSKHSGDYQLDLLPEKSISKISPASVPIHCIDLPNPCSDPQCIKYYDCNITKIYAGVTITYETTEGILKFNNASDVNIVINHLDTQDSIWNENYDNQYLNMSVEEMDSLDIVNNFDEFKIYRDFENLFPGYNSKRKQIEIAENAWLINNFSGTDPDTIDYTFDESENSIFNIANSFKIGSNIYELRSDGLYINGVPQTGVIEQMSFDAFADPCFSGKKTSFYYPPGTTKRYKLKAAIHSIGIRSSAKGKIVSYKQKNSGGWRRSRTEMAVSAVGNIYTKQCNFNFSFSVRKPSPTGFKKRKQLKVMYRDWGAGGQIVYKTKSNQMGAAFNLPNGYSALINL